MKETVLERLEELIPFLDIKEFQIVNMSDPGWLINVVCSRLETCKNQLKKTSNNNQNWFNVEKKGNHFHGFGGLSSLNILINFLINIVTSKKKSLESNEVLYNLNEWLLSNSDGDWEHLYGVQISYNDRWIIEIDYIETDLDSYIEGINIQEDNFQYKFTGSKFLAEARLGFLEDVLSVFLKKDGKYDNSNALKILQGSRVENLKINNNNIELFFNNQYLLEIIDVKSNDSLGLLEKLINKTVIQAHRREVCRYEIVFENDFKIGTIFEKNYFNIIGREPKLYLGKSMRLIKDNKVIFTWLES